MRPVSGIDEMLAAATPTELPIAWDTAVMFIIAAQDTAATMDAIACRQVPYMVSWMPGISRTWWHGCAVRHAWVAVDGRSVMMLGSGHSARSVAAEHHCRGRGGRLGSLCHAVLFDDIRRYATAFLDVDSLVLRPSAHHGRVD